MFRRGAAGLQVLLAHPGGPYWARKDQGAWSLPKGEYDDREDPLQAARREFVEETGFAVSGPLHSLGTLKQPGGKLLTVWAFEGDCDPGALVSNLFEIEWPPGSGKLRSFPEMDRAGWFDLERARTHIMRGQIPFLDHLAQQCASD
jgi:predicted NUDIX family NTP pyrophosphohydrolase